MVAGLPVKRVRVNASTWNIRKRVSAAYADSFARIRAPSYTSVNLGVVLTGPETRDFEYPIGLRTR